MKSFIGSTIEIVEIRIWRRESEEVVSAIDEMKCEELIMCE